MNVSEPRVRLRRFLAPRYAVGDCAAVRWQGQGEAHTPGADACCRLYLACDDGRIARAAFAAFGPPMVVVCADWACEWLHNRTIDETSSLSLKDFDVALAIAAPERYAPLLVMDALANATKGL